ALATITRSGVLVGTPAYLPPEALDGGATDVFGDQFSFCVTAWEALCGHRPFAGATLHEVHENIRAAAVRPMPPDRRVPRSLRRLLMKGLAAAPHERHPSMAMLARALAREQGRGRRRALGGAMVLGTGVLALGLSRTLAPEAAEPCTGSADAWARSWTEDTRAAMTASMVATGKPTASDVAQRVGDAIDDYGARWIEAHHDACMATHVRRELSEESLDLRMACLDGRRAHVDALVTSLTHADDAAV